MIFSLRTHALISAALFAALIVVAVGGNIAFGDRPLQGSAAKAGLILVFGLFLAFGFSLMPVMVMVVLAKVEAIQKPVIWILWALLLAGCLVAIPAAMKDGFFDQAPADPGVTPPQAPPTTEEPPPLAPDPRYTLPDYKPEERRTAPD